MRSLRSAHDGITTVQGALHLTRTALGDIRSIDGLLTGAAAVGGAEAGAALNRRRAIEHREALEQAHGAALQALEASHHAPARTADRCRNLTGAQNLREELGQVTAIAVGLLEEVQATRVLYGALLRTATAAEFARHDAVAAH